MDFSFTSQAKVAELAGPLNGVLVNPGTATPDQLFAFTLGYFFRKIAPIPSPKIRTLLNSATKHKTVLREQPGFTPSRSLDYPTFAPSELISEINHWMYDRFGLTASERAHRVYRASQLMSTPEATDQLGRNLPEEVLLDIFAYSLVEPTLLGKPLDLSAVSFEIVARGNQSQYDDDDRLEIEPVMVTLTSPRSRPFLQPDHGPLQHIPVEAVSARQGFSIPLGNTEFYTARIAQVERSLIATLSHAISTSHDVTAAINFGDGSAGPYLRVLKNHDRSLTAYVMSNYDLWEPNENWFTAVMTNFEWMALSLNVPGRVVYRKSWKPSTAPWHIANALALVLSNVFGIFQVGEPQVLVQQLNSTNLPEFINKHRLSTVRLFEADETVAADFVMSARLMAPEPHFATKSPGTEGFFARQEIEKALKIAEEHDDEVGMYTLEDLLHRLTGRLKIEQSWMNEISEMVTGRPSGVMMIIDDFFDNAGGSRQVTDIAMFSDRELWDLSEKNDAALFELIRRNPELGFPAPE